MGLKGKQTQYEMRGMSAVLVSDDELKRWGEEALKRMLISDKAAADWERRKPDIEAFIRERAKRLTGGREDDYEIRRQLDENWTLKDLIKKHEWNREEANRYHNAIVAQLALRQMLGKG